jgi:hypothetical protein
MVGPANDDLAAEGDVAFDREAFAGHQRRRALREGRVEVVEVDGYAPS